LDGKQLNCPYETWGGILNLIDILLNGSEGFKKRYNEDVRRDKGGNSFSSVRDRAFVVKSSRKSQSARGIKNWVAGCSEPDDRIN
jgi:hypothetical protein